MRSNSNSTSNNSSISNSNSTSNNNLTSNNNSRSNSNSTSNSRNLEVDGYQSNLYVMFFYKFYKFCWRHSLTNRPCYNNLFQFMQHDNFRNLNRVVFTHWKHLESRVNDLWNCFPVIKWYTFLYSMKSAPSPGNQSSFQILQLSDIGHYQSLVILFVSSIVILI